ncbi:hypothetical protein GCM10010271_72980 [Streptomyces kurssanovii]|nr:hypothetical protein GCM10010271_72980 [Streptomyces kurssanovii]
MRPVQRDRHDAEHRQEPEATARVPDDGRLRELSAAQCVLYRVGDVDVALAYAAELEPAVLPTPERRPVPRPTPPARSSTPVTRPLPSLSFALSRPLRRWRPAGPPYGPWADGQAGVGEE